MQFLLEPQQLFIHNTGVEIWRFSTSTCGAKFTKLYSTGNLSTFHSPCWKVGMPPRAIRARRVSYRYSSWVPLGIVTAPEYNLKHYEYWNRRPGGSKGNGVASGSSRNPLVGFFRVFLAETRKTPAGGMIANGLPLYGEGLGFLSLTNAPAPSTIVP